MRSSETPVDFCQAARLYIREGNLHSRRHEHPQILAKHVCVPTRNCVRGTSICIPDWSQLSLTITVVPCKVVFLDLHKANPAAVVLSFEALRQVHYMVEVHPSGDSVIRGQSGKLSHRTTYRGKNTEFTEFLLEGKGEDGIDNTTK